MPEVQFTNKYIGVGQTGVIGELSGYGAGIW